MDHPVLGRWLSIPEERRGIITSALLAALIFLPWLGSVGLWDPWEPHYAEVARSMLVRRDYLHPYWESAYFFSKPVGLFWLSALSMNAMGLHEWALRLPVALLAIGACCLVYLVTARLASRRAGLIAAGALATTPFYALMARQVTTDMPFVALSTGGACCFALALWDDRCRRGAWAYAGYVLLAFATLTKGLLGFALPGAAFLAWFLVSGDWWRIERLRLLERVGPLWLPLGPLVFLAIAAPWYLTLSLFPGRDDESKTFVQRFWIQDHFQRLGQGVHTTTPGGTFTYFLEQLGFGLFPWVAAVPGALGELARTPSQSREPRSQLVLFAGLWAITSYLLMSLSATKFHHYVLPTVAPMVILCAIWLDRVWREGMRRHAGALAMGLAVFAVVGQNLWLVPKHLPDLFVYNYERPYPERELMELHPGVSLGPFHFSLAPRPVMAAIFTMGGCGLVLAYLWRARQWLVGGMVALALTFAIYLSWFHWRELGVHWSQRDVFRTYHARRQSPDEPVIAYYMNWRGETFYSRNQVRQVQDQQRMREIAARPGTEWVIVEQGRYKNLAGTLGDRHKLTIQDQSANKYYLVSVE
jgi:4-amino-4-deoxy-L-arabinose transferase-like glycosyltransferase